MLTPDPRPPTPDRVTLAGRAAYAIATGAGAGFAPVAPGTLGAIEAVALFAAATALHLAPLNFLAMLVALNVVIFVAGVWASNRVCAISGIEDPGQIVVDEISGQLIALTPLAIAPSVVGVIAAFVLFRLFDIFKPYPIRKLEHFRAGWGVMLDDVLAGVYAALLVWLGIKLRLL
jgi:phosphatidylglycerophosphatase A